MTNNFDERHIGYLPANKVAAEKTAQAKTNKRLLSESPPTNTVMSTVDGARLVQDMEQQIRDGGAAGDVFTTPFEVRYVQCKIKRNGTIKSCSAKSGQMQYGTIPAPGGSGCSALINHLVGPV